MKIKLGSSVIAIVLKEDFPKQDKIKLMKSRIGPVPKKKVKLAGRVWYFFKHDLDPFPSCCHGHDYKNNQVLDVLTGNIYDSNSRKFINKLTKNQFEELKHKLEKTLKRWVSD